MSRIILTQEHFNQAKFNTGRSCTTVLCVLFLICICAVTWMIYIDDNKANLLHLKVLPTLIPLHVDITTEFTGDINAVDTHLLSIELLGEASLREGSGFTPADNIIF